MEDDAENDRDIPRREGVALVWEGFVIERRDRKTVLHDTRESRGEKELDDGETEVGFDGEFSRVCSLVVSIILPYWSV